MVPLRQWRGLRSGKEGVLLQDLREPDVLDGEKCVYVSERGSPWGDPTPRQRGGHRLTYSTKPHVTDHPSITPGPRFVTGRTQRVSQTWSSPLLHCPSGPVGVTTGDQYLLCGRQGRPPPDR